MKKVSLFYEQCIFYYIDNVVVLLGTTPIFLKKKMLSRIKTIYLCFYLGW